MQNLQSGPVAGPITDQERAYAIDVLQSTQVALRQAIDGLTESQLTYKSEADRWSITEIFITGHLLTSRFGHFDLLVHRY